MLKIGSGAGLRLKESLKLHDAEWDHSFSEENGITKMHISLFNESIKCWKINGRLQDRIYM